jgi:hypothetical protein
MVRRRTSARKKRTAYAALGSAPAKRSGGWLILVLAALVLVNLYVFVWDKNTAVRAIKERAEARSTPAMIPSRPLDAPRDAPPARVPPPIEGKVGKSDTLGGLLEQHGLRAAEADEVIRALSGVLDFRKIRAGQRFEIRRGADGRVQRFDLEVSKSHHVRAVRQPNGELTGARLGGA